MLNGVFNLILLHFYTLLYTVMNDILWTYSLVDTSIDCLYENFFFNLLRTVYSSEISVGGFFCDLEGNSAKAGQATSNEISVVVDSNRITLLYSPGSHLCRQLFK